MQMLTMKDFVKNFKGDFLAIKVNVSIPELDMRVG